MMQVPAKSLTKEDKVYFGDFLHIEKHKFHGLRKFRNVVRMITILTSHFRIPLLILVVGHQLEIIIDHGLELVAAVDVIF